MCLCVTTAYEAFYFDVICVQVEVEVAETGPKGVSSRERAVIIATVIISTCLIIGKFIRYTRARAFDYITKYKSVFNYMQLLLKT